MTVTFKEAMRELREGKLHDASPEYARVLAEEITRLWYLADCPPAGDGDCCFKCGKPSTHHVWFPKIGSMPACNDHGAQFVRLSEAFA